MPQLRSLVLILFDALGFVFALGFSAVLSRFISEVWMEQNYADLPDPDTQQLVILFAVLAIAGLVNFAQKGHYSLKAPWWQQVEQVIAFCLFALLLEGFVNYVLKTPITRLWVTLSWLAAIPSILILRWVSRAILVRLRLWNIPTILIGGWQNAVETAYALKSENYLHYSIKYAVLPNGVDSNFKEMHPDIPVKNDLGDFNRDDYIIVCPDNGDQMILKDYISSIHVSCARYAIVPPLEGFSLYGLRPQYFFGYNIALLESCRKLQTFTGRSSKWLMDKVGAAAGLLLLSPLFHHHCA